MKSARQEAKNRNIELLENNPCLEAILLSILNGGKSYSSKGSAECKKEFESNHLDAKKRTDPKEYEKLFSKSILDSKRSHVEELNRIILLMEGKF